MACLAAYERMGPRLSDIALLGRLYFLGFGSDGNLTGIQTGVPGTGLNPLLYLSLLLRTRPISQFTFSLLYALPYAST